MDFVESKYIARLNKKVLTPFGYQTIEYVHKTRPMECLKITLETREIEVAKHHTFIVQNEEVLACALRVGDFLEVSNVSNVSNVSGVSWGSGDKKNYPPKLEIIKSIEETGVKELYDISLLQEDFENQWYYTNGILSHNSGKSITVACYLVWQFNFFKQRNIGIVANRGAQAREFLKNCKDIFTRLPLWMSVGVTEWNKTSIANELNMRILTDVPSGDSFRGYSISCIHGEHHIEVVNEYGSKETIPIAALYEHLRGCSQPSPSEIEIAINNDYQILTNTGYQSFWGIRRHLDYGVIIKFEDTELKATRDHKIWSDGVFVNVGDLKIGDCVDGHKIIDIKKTNILEYYYDPVEVYNGNTYISEGFIHHNCIVVDECAFIQASKWEEFADSVFPAQGALSWKKKIIISTAKGLNHFYDLVERAKGSNIQKALTGETDGTILVEVDWREVPRYGSDGKILEPERFKANIIKKYGKTYFEQNYGNNFSGSAETLIDSNVLDTWKPQEPIEKWSCLKVYELPQPGHIYIMGVDAAKDGHDAFAVQVLDVTEFPFKQVASCNTQSNYLEMPELLYQWGADYNTALMIIENNEGAGQSVADTLLCHYEYPNLHFDNKKIYPGFRTTSKSRDKIIKMMQILGNSKKLMMRDAQTIDEFMKFEKVNGKFQASAGHDDLVMAVALAISPLCDYDNFEDFGAFLRSLNNDEVIDTSTFLTDIIGMTFADV